MPRKKLADPALVLPTIARPVWTEFASIHSTDTATLEPRHEESR